MPSRLPATASRLALMLLMGTALAGPAHAQEARATLDPINVQRGKPKPAGAGRVSRRPAQPSPAPAAAAPSGPSSASAAPALPPLEPVPGGGNGGATSGGGGGPSGVVGYTAKVSPTATKTNTPLIETPQSVSVVTREQLNDRNVQSLNEALAYTPGASTNVFGFDPRFDAIYIRGFDVTYDGIFRDGLRQAAVGLSIPRIEPYGAEAVTILRGPASGLYGLGSPGGILDVTTKRPVFTPFGELQFQAGNYDRYQGNFDFGGPIEGSDGTMAYRLTGVVRDSNTFLPGAADDRINIAPAFTWKPDADTTFTVLTEFQHTKLPGTAAFYNFSNFRVSRFYQGDPRFNAFEQDQYRIGYAFEHRFSPDLIVRQNFRYYGVNLDFPYVQIDSVNLAAGTADRSTGLFVENLGALALDNQIEGHVETGPVAHTVLAGVDYNHYDWSRRFGFGTAPDLNLNTLNYGQQFIPRPILNSTARQAQDQIGVYLQEQAKFDPFVLTLTGRHDWVFSNTSSTTAGVPDAPQSQDDKAFTYRAGLNYLLAPGLVPYASYATTFTPQVGTDVRGRAFRPATGEQIEAGVKFVVPNTNITGGVAGFDISQTSILRQDPLNIANQVATGEVNSRGFEMEATANFAPQTNLTLAYTHLDFRFVRQTSLVTGQPIDGNYLSGIPGDTFTVFGTYLFPTWSPLSGLMIGGGVRHASSSPADDENTARNKAVTLLDAVVAYDFAAIDPRYRGFRAQINGFNILDKYYTNCQAGFCYRGAPATVIGSLIYRW